jgi:hypothetical protein
MNVLMSQGNGAPDLPKARKNGLSTRISLIEFRLLSFAY